MTDYTDLIKRLRWGGAEPPSGSELDAAADALEAQGRRLAEAEAEIARYDSESRVRQARLAEVVDALEAERITSKHLRRELADAEADIERLTEAWVDGKMREDRDYLLARLAEAEALLRRAADMANTTSAGKDLNELADLLERVDAFFARGKA